MTDENGKCVKANFFLLYIIFIYCFTSGMRYGSNLSLFKKFQTSLIFLGAQIHKLGKTNKSKN